MGFYGLFSCEDNIISEFGIAPSELDGCLILYAMYEYEDYEGSALVIFERDGQLYEVHGGHCSCYGLENQWEPASATIEYLTKQYAADANVTAALMQWRPKKVWS
jgi:hypothetical protein